ncbi:MAG: cell division protein FtsZ, partial [bacterium]|nr:cell division protein FtsZ [bacterium]
LSISGGSELGIFEVNEAAEIVQGVAHPDANIIFGTVVDDSMGDHIRVTVIAAGFDRWDGERATRMSAAGSSGSAKVPDVFGDVEGDLLSSDAEDEFDIPSFLR